MTSRTVANFAQDTLTYPVLCLSQRAGIRIARSLQDLSESTAGLVWGAGFYEGLRVIDESGAEYKVIGAEVVRPRSAFAQALARLFDADVRVSPKLLSVGPASLEEVRARITAWVTDDPEGVEEMTGHARSWWNETLSRCTDASALVRAMDAAARAV